jgi:hypothetical protein
MTADEQHENARILIQFTNRNPSGRKGLEKVLRAFGGQCVQLSPLAVVQRGYYYGVGEHIATHKLHISAVRAVVMNMVAEKDGLHFDEATAKEWIALFYHAERMVQHGFDKIAPYIYGNYMPPSL